jgi:hypothetical protein
MPDGTTGKKAASAPALLARGQADAGLGSRDPLRGCHAGEGSKDHRRNRARRARTGRRPLSMASYSSGLALVGRLGRTITVAARTWPGSWTKLWRSQSGGKGASDEVERMDARQTAGLDSNDRCVGIVAPEGPVFISAANVRNLTDTVVSPPTALPQMRG